MFVKKDTKKELVITIFIKTVKTTITQVSKVDTPNYKSFLCKKNILPAEEVRHKTTISKCKNM